ncbi:MAG: neutral/alkaline non-lysosomal ceramidase N-terminal domain-containing protein [Verrucomicrobiota bacterium]
MFVIDLQVAVDSCIHDYIGGGVFFVSGVSAEQSDLFSVGVAKVDITPHGAIRLAGYANRREPSQGVASKIWAKALVIGSDDQKPSVLITAELIRAPGVLVEALAARLKKKMGLERSQLAVCVTHTHSGPALSSMLVDSYFGSNIPAPQKARIKQYTDHLLDLLEQLVLDALDNRQPSQLSWDEGLVGFATNRRMVKDGKWVGMRPNEAGVVDHALPVLRVLGAEGELRALFLSYACHGTTYGSKFNKIHGDWAGAAAQILEDKHPDCIAMVALGCGGDANPKPRGVAAGFDVVNRHGQAVAGEVERLLEGGMKVLKSKPDCRIKQIELSVDHVPGRDELQQRLKQGANAAYFAQVMLDRLDRGEVTPAAFSYPIQVWNFGEDLSMVFLAGEVVAGYSLRLKRESGRRSLWVNAYSNDDPCYIATKKMIPEGGYEVDQSMDSFAKASRLSLDVEDKIIEATLSLLR